MKRRDFITGGAAALALGTPKEIGTEGIPIPSGTTADIEFPFKHSAIKFRLESLMAGLSEKEGWMSIAYPDSSAKGIPTIGMGFNLSIEGRPRDDADPYQNGGWPRKDPSAQELWKIAGLPEEKLKDVMANFEERNKRWHGRQAAFKFLDHFEHDITRHEAHKLLYVSARQAVYNAMAYAKDFPDMNGAQQMAMAQIVYQMGTKLEGFKDFLGEINNTSYHQQPELAEAHWRAVQSELIKSDWYRNHTTRATKVIAMFDPQYRADAKKAQKNVEELAQSIKAQQQSSVAGVRPPEKNYVSRESAKPGSDERGRH
jgi:GH24 family phage-related lysozyme (muramidase)